MKRAERYARGRWLRERIAYLYLGRGLLIKECADILGISERSAFEHWENAKAQIRGVPMRWKTQ